MSDSAVIAGWTRPQYPTPQRSLQQLRSITAPAHETAPKPARPVSKSVSSSALHTMAAVSTAPGIPISRNASFYNDEDGSMSTLPDPRSRTMSPANGSSPTSPSQHHPDLSNEVATLSNKLINAINHQTNLDDTLSATRQELEASRERVKQLEREKIELERGVWVKKSTVEADRSKLLATLAEEKRNRREVEKDKKNIEQELENLTAALFEEANKMVVTAKAEAQKEHDAIQRKNDQLKAQLADTENLLKSHQEQLAELKQVMEQMTEERDDLTNPTTPSTPGVSKFDSKDEADHNRLASHSAAIPEPVSPTYPTSFTHLLQTVLRTDLSAYDDFTSLLRMSKNVLSSSRASSGSYGSYGLGLGLGGYSAHISSAGALQAHTNGSTSSLSTPATLSSSPVTPTTPGSALSTASANGPNSLTPLKETKFYKRALAEDIEPTLRLDTAPGLSWLARRTVLNAMCEGTLVVEPMPTSTKVYPFSCSLCGESRKDATHTRSHRFRTSESENSQRYPLCKYCLGRVRSTCDFLGFLRVLKDGHWRAEDEESERAAWEESVRLREQMFWCRMGGGVVPASHGHGHAESSRSPSMTLDEKREQERKLSEEFERTGEIQPRDVTPAADPPQTTEDPENKITVTRTAAETEEREGTPETHNTARDSTLSTASLKVTSPGNGEKDGGRRLSISIP